MDDRDVTRVPSTMEMPAASHPPTVSPASSQIRSNVASTSLWSTQCPGDFAEGLSQLHIRIAGHRGPILGLQD